MSNVSALTYKLTIRHRTKSTYIHTSTRVKTNRLGGGEKYNIQRQRGLENKMAINVYTHLQRYLERKTLLKYR